jgi:hypothetical protein
MQGQKAQPILTATDKIKKKGEIDMIVRKANSFSESTN